MASSTPKVSPSPSTSGSPSKSQGNILELDQPLNWEVNQEYGSGGINIGGAESFSNLAAKTVANIKRLQENVGGAAASAQSNGGISSVWVGNYQLPAQTEVESAVHVQQIAVTSPGHMQKGTGVGHKVKGRSSPPLSPLPCISSTLTSTFNALVTIDPNWQSNKKSLRERNAVMCNNALMADTYFNIGGEFGTPKKFPAHKYILATGSSVFYAMFFGGLADDKDVIEVPDVEPVAFHAMLKYLYCDEIALENDNVLATLYCAKKYIVPHLAQECIKFLENSLTAKNACVLLSQSRLFEEPALMERSWEVIDAQAALALLSESFTDIDFETLKVILLRETLNCKETVIFHAALNWAKAEASRRNVPDSPEKLREILGPTLNMIRFPAMSVQDFADEVVHSKILTLEETTDLFLHFTATKSKPTSNKFPICPRVGLQKQVCHRFQSSAYRSNQWRYRGRCDSIQFCVDKRIFIVGFGLFGSSNGSSDYTAKIELKASHGGRSLASNTCKFFSDGSSNTFQVFFNQPVQVEADQFYTASVVLDGAELSYFGQEGMSEFQAGSVTFQFQCSSESTNGTGVQGGQIPELLFYGPSTNSVQVAPCSNS